MTSDQAPHDLYIAFVICLISSCIPQMHVQTFLAIFSIVMIIAFYVVRSRTTKESARYKSIAHLIKTFWIWSALYVAGVTVAGIIITVFGDMSAMHAFVQNIVETGTPPSEDDMKAVIQSYIDTNLSLMVSSTIICIIPAQIYAVKRLVEGWKADTTA